VTRWLAAFALTQALEMPVYARALGPERTWALRLAIAFGASAITHPLVWFSHPLLGWPWLSYVVAAEGFAVTVEMLWLRRFGVPHAFWWSLCANALSAGVGLGVRALAGWP
jgi:hypothetical protein